MAERLIITQDLCRKVQVMLKGTTIKETAKLLGVGESTIGRIKQAGFDVEQYRKITDARKEKEQPAEEQLQTLKMYMEKKTGGLELKEMQVPGQLEMDLLCGKDGEKEKTQPGYGNFMRLFAGQSEKILEKLDKINDNLCQLLRRTDG